MGNGLRPEATTIEKNKPKFDERNRQSAEDLEALIEKSNERIRNSEARIRTLVETIPLGLLITTTEGAIESASPACLNFFGCTYSDLHARNVRDLFVFDESAAQDLCCLVSDQARDVMARRRDGSQFPASIRVGSFAGTSPGLLIVVEDVTAKHELEQMKQEFLSMMTHDLRTPLTSIKCFLELIVEGVYETRPDELKRRSKSIGNDTGRLINMITSMISLHKLESGRLQLSVELVEVSSVINQSVESVLSYAESRSVSLDVRYPPQEMLVSADENYTVQVLVNLLSNAIKFSSKGGTVTVLADANNEFVRLMVSDKGRGIPKEFQSRLFNRFEQARLSDSRVEGGSGLGLAISKAIVEEQGGTIGVESEPGQGCNFWFTMRRELPE